MLKRSGRRARDRWTAGHAPERARRRHVEAHSSIHRVLAARARQAPQAVAIEARGRAPLTYGRLLTCVEETVRGLRASGLAPHDRVAVVVPNGPEMAVLCLGVAAGAVAAPLNPAYGIRELDRYLALLKARAIIVAAGMDSPARVVAHARRIPVLEARPVARAEAGVFRLEAPRAAAGVRPGFASASDTAFVFQTGGTTALPKVVPLTHRQLCTAADNVGRALRLTPADRCLNIMPLFHVHGLIGAILASVVAGARVACAPTFHPPRFFEWMDEFRPTWYTAVPAMHLALLRSSADCSDILTRHRLRFIRSASAALPPRVMAELEERFAVPVIEAYGMTEAAHQIASNPLPPGTRKAGSVGRPVGVGVAVMDEAGELLPTERLGEIVISGPTVMRGYEGDAEPIGRRFEAGWFRTGDQGFLDGDGYLFINGRLAELINRCGEKISPREVEAVLADHPAVSEAVSFPVVTSDVVEEVGALVVLRPGAALAARDVREFVGARLAEFKVPTRIVFASEVPRGPTGKIERLHLAERLGLRTNGAAWSAS